MEYERLVSEALTNIRYSNIIIIYRALNIDSSIPISHNNLLVFFYFYLKSNFIKIIDVRRLNLVLLNNSFLLLKKAL